MPAVIDSFDGEFEFLSNFHAHPMTVGGIEFMTLEAAFQASKTFDQAERLMVASKDTPGKAKRAGKKVTLRPDWEDVKVRVMLGLVRRKFQDSRLRELLLATGDADLIEGNNWNDRFWGVCKGAGRNELGKILMGVRSEIRATQSENNDGPGGTQA